MKLADALALRADLQRRVEQLRERIHANARYQEGETPAEDAAALLTEAGTVLTQLQSLIAAINTTNANLRLDDGTTMTQALAARDVLRLRHGVLSSSADVAAGGGGYRQMRSELRQLSALDVPVLRAEADAVAQQLRALDGRIPAANWTNELQEG